MKQLIFCCTFMAFAAVCFGQTPAQNKTKVNEFYAAFSGDFSKFDAANFVTTDFVDYTLPATDWSKMGKNGVERFQAIMSVFKQAFPDIKIRLVKSIAEGSTVMAYYEMSGTFKGDFMGIKANNKTFKIMDVDIVEFDKSGKAVSHWAVQDPSIMWKQLGVDMH